MDTALGAARRKGARIPIRPATEADTERIAALAGELGYPCSAESVARRLQFLATRPDLHAVFVAEERGGIVAAWIHVFVAHRLESDPFAEIGGLVVGADARGTGLGEALVHEAERWAHERGMNRIRVRSNVVREGAHLFYERLGYERIKDQAVFDKPLRPG